MVAALVVVLLAGFVAATIRTNHQLGEQLVADVAALRARRVKVLRPDGALPPRNDNGLLCFASVAKTAPSLAAFNGEKERNAFAWGDKPLSELPDSTRAAMDPLRPWVEAMRGCGDAAELQWVEAVEPWNDSWALQTKSTLLVHTALDVRLLLAQGHAPRALQVCTEGLEANLDLSRLGLIDAMLAANAVLRLAPLCSEAWGQVTAEVRRDVGPRWVLLSTRLASDAELLEVERVAMSLALFAPLASAESRAKLPAAAALAFELSRVERLLLTRLWAPWDAKMRQLAAAKDEASFSEADARLREHPWWLQGSILTAGDGYAEWHARLNRARAVLSVLASISAGTPLPPGAVEKDGVITLPASGKDEALSLKR